MYVLFILRSEMLPTLTASKATLLFKRRISKETTFPSTGLSSKTRRLAENQPRRKWLLVMEQSRETLSCTFWSKEWKCWNVDRKTIKGNYNGFDCCAQTCKRIFRSSAPELFYFILINYNSNALFGNYLHLWGYRSVEVDDLITKLLISARTHASFLFFFFFVFFPPKPRRWYTRCHRAIFWISALSEPTWIKKVWSFNWKNMLWQESSKLEDYRIVNIAYATT